MKNDKQTKGIKYDQKKLRYDLIPIEPIEEIAKVLTYGAEKYSENSWQGLDNFNDRYYAALLRHLLEWKKGNETDGESGLLHLSHVIVNAMFLLWKNIKTDKDKKI